MDDAQRRALRELRNPATIRRRCRRIFAAAKGGDGRFVVDLGRLQHACNLVLQCTRAQYPDLEIPFHSRWRHFDAGGKPRWPRIAARLDGANEADTARCQFDLAIVSVLLDAGAGPGWHYEDAFTGRRLSRSEGLAVASFDLFESGAFSSDRDRPLQVDADGLAALNADRLAAGFQVTANNPLIGLDGRMALLHHLGETLSAKPAMFGHSPPRPGCLFDHLVASAGDGRLSAGAILGAVLAGLSDIWPSRLKLGGENLGDVWKHPAAGGQDADFGLVPFHKLSQWLSYSLMEPLREAGIEVTELDTLTGLAEYRNGGLLLDTGVIRPVDATDLDKAHSVDSPLIVEWRALTVVLLDMIAESLRQRLGRNRQSLPLVCVLQGGTWAAGRNVAHELRPGGGPPLRIVSDGTVF